MEPVYDQVIYRHLPITHTAFDFNAIDTYGRFACTQHFAPLALNTVTIPDIFDYLDNPTVRQRIVAEFAMYRHHHQPLTPACGHGLMRNMYHSLIQQVLRQDPVAYALAASTSPGKAWRLITFPGIALDVAAMSTGAADNIQADMFPSIETPSGADVVQSDIILPTPSSSHLGTSPSISTFNLQLTPSSTLRPAYKGRVLQGWYCAIDDQHNLIGSDDDSTLTWSGIAACHRDLEAPDRDINGQTPWFGRPDYRFPGSVVLQSSSALGDALVGRRKWTDPQVVEERDVLLGSDREKSLRYVTAVRARLLARYEEAYGLLQLTERAAFGKVSYWKSLDV